MSKKLFCLISFVLVLGLVSTSCAYNTWTWDNDNGSGDRLWQTAANWDPYGVPAAGDWVIIDDTYTDDGNGPIINAGKNAVCEWLDMGYYALPPGGIEAVLTMTGGTLTATTYLTIGNYAAGNARFNISGGVVVTEGFWNGWYANGTVNMNSGEINASWFYIAGTREGITGNGHVDLHGGTINAGGLTMGGAGIATMDITEGTLIIDGDWTGVTGYIFDPDNDTPTSEYGNPGYTGTLAGLISKGLITAYDVKNGEIAANDQRVVVKLDYNRTNPGKTTLFATTLDPYLAWNPNPCNGASGQPQLTIISWSQGKNAASHNMYFGTSFNDVNNATTSSPEFKGNQVLDANSYDAGPLDLGKTYYWRIDEVNGLNIWKGNIWSFSTFTGVATEPYPKDGASYVRRDVALHWKPGAEVVSHEVYFSTDFNDVNDRDADTLTVRDENNYDPGPLELNTTYYWAVDEVNLTAAHKRWKGDVWSFTVAELAIIKVMSFNMWGGGDSWNKCVDAMRDSGADIIGLQEAANFVGIANSLGFYYDEGTSTLSRYPITAVQGSGYGQAVTITLPSGQDVYVFNCHLPAYPYGPYRLPDVQAALQAELQAQWPALGPILLNISFYIATGKTCFLTGDFNVASHLDYANVPWKCSQECAHAGLADSYRSVHPDNRTYPPAFAYDEPGITWTPKPSQEPYGVYDRIDFVYSSGSNVRCIFSEELDGRNSVSPWPSDHRAVVSTFRLGIQAEMKLTPQTLNCNSKGNWVKAHFVLPEGILPEDVDVNAPAVAEPMGAESTYIKVFGNDDGPVRLEICFDREAFCDKLQDTDNGSLEVTVVGSLTTGQYFYGSDTIRIIE